MKTFSCSCGNTVYFENNQCLACGRALGFLPASLKISALESSGENSWRALVDGQLYRQCQNYSTYNVCNWMISADDESAFCASCRLNHVIPDLSQSQNLTLWYRVEAAKRRLLYGLLGLGLDFSGNKAGQHAAMGFEFLADPNQDVEFADTVGYQQVLTGHMTGVITINIREADDSTRERLRENMNERYRTLLGHFRHESGHFYWERLVVGGHWLEKFRNLFGDERKDYQSALQSYYQNGPPSGWQDNFISEYASSHPWEDWAETWAHYLHMVDTMETASDFGFRLSKDLDLREQAWRQAEAFDLLIGEWTRLGVALNALNRSMGLPDAYPFSIAGNAANKLQFVHEVIESSCSI